MRRLRKKAKKTIKAAKNHWNISDNILKRKRRKKIIQ